MTQKLVGIGHDMAGVQEVILGQVADRAPVIVGGEDAVPEGRLMQPLLDQAEGVSPLDRVRCCGHVGAKDLHDAGDDVPEATVQVIGVKDRCARCNVPLLSKDLARKVNGRFYHRHCVDHAKPIAIAAA